MMKEIILMGKRNTTEFAEVNKTTSKNIKERK